MNARELKTPPPATEMEIRDASLQFVRKLSGFNMPSKGNEIAFERAIEEIAASARTLIAALTISADPRNRAVEAAKARARSDARFGTRDEGPGQKAGRYRGPVGVGVD